MSRIKVPVKRLDDTIDLPEYAYEGDAGLDLRAAEDTVLNPFGRQVVSCGIAIAIPHGYAGFVLPRSGLAAKHGISIVNAPGLIDSNYRGEIKVILINLGTADFTINSGDRIAQMIVAPVTQASFTITDSLSETERGSGGFGSTGLSASGASGKK